MLNYPRAGRRGAHRSSDRYSGRNAFAVSTRRSASPVTFTESDVTVGMSISRVTQHRVMSYSAGDGRELFRWPWNGRLSLIFSVLSTLRGGQKVTETVTYTRYLASGTCLTLCTHRQYTCGGGGDRKPRTKSLRQEIIYFRIDFRTFQPNVHANKRLNPMQCIMLRPLALGGLTPCHTRLRFKHQDAARTQQPQSRLSSA